MKRCSIRSLIPWTTILVAATCLSQAAEVKTDDLKAIRASLERLVQLTQELDNNQKAMLSVQQTQLYELRLEALENREDALAERERSLSARTSDLQRAFKDTDASVGPTGVPGKPSDSDVRKAMGDQLDSAEQMLENTRAKKQQVEREIADLRARIESLQQMFHPDSAR